VTCTSSSLASTSCRQFITENALAPQPVAANTLTLNQLLDDPDLGPPKTGLRTEPVLGWIINITVEDNSRV